MINKYKYYVYFFLITAFFVANGQSIQDMKKMQDEYKKFQETRGVMQGQESIDNNVDFNTSNQNIPKIEKFAPYQLPESLELDPKTLHFGYDFFTSRDSTALWANLPAPANYLLGAGDELIISLWGQTQLRQTYTISRDGKIYDDKVGLLNLSNRTLNEAYKYLKNQYGRVYSTLNGDNPSSFIDVSLGQLKSINVNFVGHVEYPGVYPIHPFSTIITGLIQAGGVDTLGSLRAIKIKRDGKIFDKIDMYDYLLYGALSSNIQLRDQDIIIVPPRTSFVHIDSAVVSPGIYEALKSESIFNLIQHAGGPRYDAAEKIGIRQINSNRDLDNQNYKSFYIDYSNSRLFTAEKVDKIIFQHLFIDPNKVEIIGQVKRPGDYFYYNGMTLDDLFSLAGGFRDTTFVKSIFLEKAQIIRRNPNSSYESLIDLNLNDIINNSSADKILLQNLDRIVIHANQNFFERKNVKVYGQVNVPGDYPVISDNESLSSFLNRAGGLTSKALINGVEIYRSREYFKNSIVESVLLREEKSLISLNEGSNKTNSDEEDENKENKESKIRVAWQNDSIVLMPGDSIYVKERTVTVNVSGEVYNPGLIEFNKGKSLRYYVNAAGGITDKGNKKNIIVIYANGHVKPKKWFLSPKIHDGATIIVNQKEVVESFNLTQFATNWTSIITSMITAIILSKQLSGV
jgi:protein involved in polysaccharide export with SLBB domain